MLARVRNHFALIFISCNLVNHYRRLYPSRLWPTFFKCVRFT